MEFDRLRRKLSRIALLFSRRYAPRPPGEKALVLSGGGTKGIFQVGALEYLLKERGERFKIICGVSAGALNGVMVAQGMEYFERLKEIWMQQATSGVELIRDRFNLAQKVLMAILPGLALHRILEMDGLQDNAPLLQVISENTTELVQNLQKTQTHLRVGVVSLQTGRYYALDPADPSLRDHIPQLILASTAIPIAFSPGRFTYDESQQWIDGGVNQATPIEDAIHVADSLSIPLSEVIVIGSDPMVVEPELREFKGLFDIALRAEHIIATELDRKGFDLFRLHNAILKIHRRLRDLFPGRRELVDSIFKEALGESYAFLRRRQAVDITVIHPDPDKWRDFREQIADRYPIEGEPDFAREYPQTLNKEGRHLLLAYEFGYYMAKRCYEDRARKSDKVSKKVA
jgi:NTE family protein